MAPEQTRNAREVGSSADLFSAGATLFALVTRRPPMVLEALEVRPEYLESVHPSVQAIIRKACADDPSHRFENAREMAEAVASAYDDVIAAEGGGSEPVRATWMNALDRALAHSQKHLEDEKTKPPSPQREARPRELRTSLGPPGQGDGRIERIPFHVAEKKPSYFLAGLLGTLGTLILLVIAAVFLIVLVLVLV
jgi:serine/threonine protein kinase